MPKDLSRVQTVVIAMLENRSFDHILGYLGLPDSGHPLASRIRDPTRADLYAHDTYPPRPITSPSLTPDPLHERENIDTQINSILGPMHGFVQSYQNAFPNADVARVMSTASTGTCLRRIFSRAILRCATTGSLACPRARCRIA